MRPGSYAVIRYIADPGRNEPLNIGVVAWDATGYRVSVDEQAIARVIHGNPRLERDALLYVEPMLRRQLGELHASTPDDLTTFLAHQSGFPISFTEPRYNAVMDGEDIDTAAERLLDRIVRPKRRPGGGGFDPIVAFDRRFRPLIQRRIVFKNHFFEASRTGVPRQVDFYANHGSDVAVDTIRLAITRGDEIARRADAQAFKIEDIQAKNSNVRFLVYCQFSPEEDVQAANSTARRILESVGAAVATDVDEAVNSIERLVSNSR